MRSRRVYHHEAGLSPRRVSGSKCRGFVARSLRRCACHPRATSLFDHIDLYLPSVRNWPFSHSRSLFQAVMHESKFFDLASAVWAAQTFSGVYSTKIISSCRIRRTQGVDDGEKSSSTGADRVISASYGLTTDPAKAQTPATWPQVGMLTCKLNPSIGFVIIGYQSMDCSF